VPPTYIPGNYYNYKQFESRKLLSFSEGQPDLEKFRNLFSQNFENFLSCGIICELLQI